MQNYIFIAFEIIISGGDTEVNLILLSPPHSIKCSKN